MLIDGTLPSTPLVASASSVSSAYGGRPCLAGFGWRHPPRTACVAGSTRWFGMGWLESVAEQSQNM